MCARACVRVRSCLCARVCACQYPCFIIHYLLALAFADASIAFVQIVASCSNDKTVGLGFGVWGLGFGVWGLGFGVWALGFGVWGLVFGVHFLGLGGSVFMLRSLNSATLLFAITISPHPPTETISKFQTAIRLRFGKSARGQTKRLCGQWRPKSPTSEMR